MSINIAYFSLTLLLILTFLSSLLSIGRLSEIVAAVFAVMKALIILNVFMHYRSEQDTSRIYFIVGLLAIALLLTGILDDVIFR